MIRLSTVSALLAPTIAVASPGDSATTNGPTHQGVDVRCDVRLDDQVRNDVGIDGSGLCTFASIETAARYVGAQPLVGLVGRMVAADPGGGWPEKVETILGKYDPEGLVPWVQYEGTDPAILDAAMDCGYPVAITYGYGEAYGEGRTIHHMVTLLHLDDSRACIVDNNGEAGKYVWMPRAELLRRATHPDGYMWAVVLLGDPPPPLPINGPEVVR